MIITTAIITGVIAFVIGVTVERHVHRVDCQLMEAEIDWLEQDQKFLISAIREQIRENQEFLDIHDAAIAARENVSLN